MKKVLILLMMMLGIIQAHAKEAYAVFENGTLTLYYDDARSSRSGTVYSVPNKTCGLPSLPNEWSPTIIGGIPPGHPWHEKSEETNKIVFDPSFTEYKPTITYGWFTCFNANSIQGLEYLNTSEVTDMRYMFAGCEYLTQLDLTHLSISESTLSSNLCEACLKLESVSLGNSIKNIGKQAFYWCLKLGSIVIPKTVSQIGDNVFGRCDILTSISVEEGNPNYDSRGGCNALINTSTNELMRGTVSTVIPNGIKAIGENAFSLLTLNAISIPNSVSQIKKSAFYGVRGITEITIPNSISEIGESAFYMDGLVTVNSLIEHPFVIASSCFSNNTKQNGILNIPYGTMSLYDVCEGWNEFANIVDPSGEKKKEKYAFLKDGVLTYCYDGEKSNREGEIFGFHKNGEGGDFDDLRPEITWDIREEIKKIVILPSFSMIKIESAKGAFLWFSELSEIEGLQYIGTSNMTDMSNMFGGCYKLTSIDVSSFNTSNVTNMSGMFSNCHNLTSLDVSNFNTSNVTDMSGMFSSCYRLTSLDVSHFNTSNVTDMNGMFSSCNILTSLDVSHFNTSNVTNMGGMFSGCGRLTSLDVSHVNTSNVIDMSEMFRSCDGFTSIDINSFNTSNVTNMRGMFKSCRYLTSIDVSNFNTSNVTNMSSMFSDCSSLTNLDLSNFNTSNVTDMGSMFSGCRKIQIIKLGEMFIPKSGFFERHTPTEDISLSKIISLNENPTSIASDCFPDDVKSSVLLLVPKGTIEKYKSTDGWKEFLNILDEQKEVYGVFKDGVLAIYADEKRNEKDGDTYDVVSEDGKYSGWDKIKNSIATIVIDSSLRNTYPDHFHLWFTKSQVKIIIGLEHVNTKNVTNMFSLFGACSKLESVDLSSFNTDNVSDMRDMFQKCLSLKTLDLSKFNTSKVTAKYMSNMFYCCEQLTSVTISKDFTQFPEKLFADCKNLSSFTTLIEEPIDIPSNCFADNVKANATLRVPKGTVALYQSKEGWKEFRKIVEIGEENNESELDPLDAGDNVDYGNGSGINGDTDLNGNVIGNIYYNISDDNGEYSSTEGCIILKKSSTDNSMEGKDLFDEDLKNNFTGIILMVQGSGTIKVNAETVGNMTLKVKIGNSAPITLELEGKMKASFPYSVTEPTYVYIYGGETQTVNARGLRAASSGNALKIYGIEWSDEYEINGIETIETRTDKAVIYNLHGQRMQTVTKGINIINGKKVMVK